ncbi:MAG: SDR family oxidoreductase [Candidatus Hodarchaeales archaeon]|jgi:NAD(P)-dependent dehydrogenase (short-subunit alcohol dehydrogenase family)
MQLKGQTAIVTGSTSGIGKKTAELLLREGCQVVISSRNEDRVKQTVSEFDPQFGDSVLGIPCDVSDSGSVKDLVEKTINSFETIEILVANAGINTIYGPFEGMSLEEIASHSQQMLNVNLNGMMNSVATVLPHMIKQGYGRIITLSGGGAQRPMSHMTLYSASKGGVVAFSQCLAEELKAKHEDIKLNIFVPGMIKTNLGRDMKIVQGWKSSEDFERDRDLIDEILGADIEQSCSKVIPFVLPSCKKNGETFRGFSIWKMIRNGRKLRAAMKESEH